MLAKYCGSITSPEPTISTQQPQSDTLCGRASPPFQQTHPQTLDTDRGNRRAQTSQKNVRMTSNGACPVMKPDKIRNKDDTSTMSLSVECPRHTKHLQHRASPYRNRWKPVGLVCGNHELEREECQGRACQWNEQGDTRLQTKHCSDSWDCRASLSFKRMRTALMASSLPSACQAQYGAAILAPERRAKEQTRCLYKTY